MENFIKVNSKIEVNILHIVSVEKGTIDSEDKPGLRTNLHSHLSIQMLRTQYKIAEAVLSKEVRGVANEIEKEIYREQLRAFKDNNVMTAYWTLSMSDGNKYRMHTDPKEQIQHESI